MPSPNLHRLHRLLKRGTIVLSILTVLTIGSALRGIHSNQSALIISRLRPDPPWVIFDQDEILGGVSVPADTNVVFHLPSGTGRIPLDVLFGYKSSQVRFWGYCLPENYRPEVQAARVGLPGQLFLSLKERRVRAEQAKESAPRFSLFSLPSKQDLAASNSNPLSGEIRHQVDVFEDNMMCYLMTEDVLPLGIDLDNDGLNGRLEHDLGTRPDLVDTDADGIADGVEFRTGTSPTQRDSDLDGLLDGIEDRNWNGRIDPGETDPRNIDSDRDELCDGLCEKKLRRNETLYLGEDVNLNGQVDDGESDPLQWDSNGNGSSDYQEFLLCHLQGNTDCGAGS